MTGRACAFREHDHGLIPRKQLAHGLACFRHGARSPSIQEQRPHRSAEISEHGPTGQIILGYEEGGRDGGQDNDIEITRMIPDAQRRTAAGNPPDLNPDSQQPAQAARPQVKRHRPACGKQSLAKKWPDAQQHPARRQRPRDESRCPESPANRGQAAMSGYHDTNRRNSPAGIASTSSSTR
jgi:hypothetical protein